MAIFREYLRSLPEELLDSVTEDYVWLAGLDLDDGDFLRRRECCRDEWASRGELQHYYLAENKIA